MRCYSLILLAASMLALGQAAPTLLPRAGLWPRPYPLPTFPRSSSQEEASEQGGLKTFGRVLNGIGQVRNILGAFHETDQATEQGLDDVLDGIDKAHRIGKVLGAFSQAAEQGFDFDNLLDGIDKAHQIGKVLGAFDQTDEATEQRWKGWKKVGNILKGAGKARKIGNILGIFAQNNQATEQGNQAAEQGWGDVFRTINTVGNIGKAVGAFENQEATAQGWKDVFRTITTVGNIGKAVGAFENQEATEQGNTEEANAERLRIGHVLGAIGLLG